MSEGALRVLQATAWYPPHSVGGTEIYVAGLVEALRGVGIASTVLTPRPVDGSAATYVHAGAPVATYPVDPMPAPGEMHLGKPHLGFETFRACLAAHAGAIYHQHSWTRGCGLHHLRAARAAGLKTVLTVHVPNIICLRGTMLNHGRASCDGRVEERRCGGCWAHGRGLPLPAAKLLARLPLAWSRRARLRWRTRLATALAARALGAERLDQITEMIGSADRVVAVCQWLYDALAANGVPRTRLILSRQGLPAAFLEAAATADPAPPSAGGPLRLVYVGRWDWLKGIDIVVRAIRALPRDTAVKLTVHASPGGAEDAAYERSIRKLAADDTRIAFAGPLPRSELAPALARHHALVVPSRWLETGPLVVMEAQAIGLHILGANLGGITELIKDGNGGELIEAQSIPAWSAAIARLAGRRPPTRAPPAPGTVRSMAAVAAEMADVYRSL
jgi:glycosyltransferase involved in cell wall biosynthesis